jgi:zinc/manganese transport system substrate-binding protein
MACAAGVKRAAVKNKLNSPGMFKIPAAFLLVLVLVLTTLACQPVKENNGKKTIMVTYSILGAVVKDLVGDQADVSVSIPNGLDPHEWEPSARDIEAINKADLVVRNGLGLESGMEKSLSAAKNQGVRIFTASEHIDIRYVGAGEGIPSDDPDQAVGAADPHLWTDPAALISVVEALDDELQQQFGMDVSARAADLKNRLNALNTQVAGLVAAVPPDQRKLVTGHESMGYFARQYGFKLVGVIIPGLSTQAGVSASNLAELKKTIAENRVRVIFTELGTSPAVAKAIGDETGARVVELSTHVLPADGSYFTFLLDMARVITGALKE